MRLFHALLHGDAGGRASAAAFCEELMEELLWLSSAFSDPPISVSEPDLEQFRQPQAQRWSPNLLSPPGRKAVHARLGSTCPALPIRSYKACLGEVPEELHTHPAHPDRQIKGKLAPLCLPREAEQLGLQCTCQKGVAPCPTRRGVTGRSCFSPQFQKLLAIM